MKCQQGKFNALNASSYATSYRHSLLYNYPAISPFLERASHCQPFALEAIKFEFNWCVFNYCRYLYGVVVAKCHTP